MERSHGPSKFMQFLGELLNEALGQLLQSLLDALPAAILIVIVIGFVGSLIWAARAPKSQFDEWCAQSRKRERLKS